MGGFPMPPTSWVNSDTPRRHRNWSEGSSLPQMRPTPEAPTMRRPQARWSETVSRLPPCEDSPATDSPANGQIVGTVKRFLYAGWWNERPVRTASVSPRANRLLLQTHGFRRLGLGD